MIVDANYITVEEVSDLEDQESGVGLGYQLQDLVCIAMKRKENGADASHITAEEIGHSEEKER